MIKKMLKNIFKNQSGVTLIESLVAMFIMVVGLVALITLALSSLYRARVSKEQIVATTLVREGIEIVRAVRDTGWLGDINCWDEDPDGGVVEVCGLTDGLYALDYEDASGLPSTISSDEIEDFAFATETGSILKKDITGFYNTSSGDNTIYRRVIQIEDSSSDLEYQAKRVRCKVYWQSQKHEFSVESETILTNWR
jgi:type II secretory pathway pseudopilin PulG